MIPEEVAFHEAFFQRYLSFVAIETLVAVSCRVAPSRRSIMFNVDHSSRLSYDTVRELIDDLSKSWPAFDKFYGKLASAKCRYFIIHYEVRSKILNGVVDFR